jgi:hypothetical protein
MAKCVLKLVAAVMLATAALGMAPAQSSEVLQAQSRPRVTIHNNSNQFLTFTLRSAYSQLGEYRLAPRQTRTYFCNCASTPHFIVAIATTGRGIKRYTLYPGRRYQLKWDRRVGLWNVFTMRAGRRPAGPRPRVTIYNNSNQFLTFTLRSAYSQLGEYRLAPRQTRTYYCKCRSTPHFIVAIATTGRGIKRYTLYPDRRYQLKWDRRVGLWNVFSMRAGVRPPPGGGVPPGAGGGRPGPGGPRGRGPFLVRGVCPAGSVPAGAVRFANVGRNDRNEGAANFIRLSLCSRRGRSRLTLVSRGRACRGRIVSRTRFQNVANSDFNEGAPNFVRLVLCQNGPLRRRYQITTGRCRGGTFPRSRVRFKNVGNSDFNDGAPNFLTVRLCVG